MDRADIQGLVFHGYGKQPNARFYLLRFDGGEGREWLRRVLYEVSTGVDGEHERFRFNLAFSASGLRALGLSESTLATFPREFVQGMAHPERSVVLGDVGEDAPEHWQFGGSPDKRVDALALLYAPTEELLTERACAVENQLERFDLEYVAEGVRLSADGKEHFGFADGISQPHVRGSGRKRPPGERRLAAGEFVLGYPNSYGRLPHSPRAPSKHGTRQLPPYLPGRREIDFGRNGSYLVLRKLEQRVFAFWQYAREAARALGETATGCEVSCASRLIGRWPSGAPLVLSPNQDALPNADLNDFSFRRDDPDGHNCPIGAHIRRANPRDMLGLDQKQARIEADRHRLIRRGRLYGPKPVEPRFLNDDGAERGLYFVALNANIRRQFEFVQQTWINNPKFGGLSDERDPLVGQDPRAPADRSELVFSIQGRPARQRISGLPRFVRVRGGEYFFLPSLSALNYLAEA